MFCREQKKKSFLFKEKRGFFVDAGVFSSGEKAMIAGGYDNEEISRKKYWRKIHNSFRK